MRVSLTKHGWVSSISKVQVVEVMPKEPPEGFKLLREHLAGAEAQGGIVQFALSAFPHSDIRKFKWLDGNHRIAALLQLLAELLASGTEEAMAMHAMVTPHCFGFVNSLRF